MDTLTSTISIKESVRDSCSYVFDNGFLNMCTYYDNDYYQYPDKFTFGWGNNNLTLCKVSSVSSTITYSDLDNNTNFDIFNLLYIFNCTMSFKQFIKNVSCKIPCSYTTLVNGIECTYNISTSLDTKARPSIIVFDGEYDDECGTFVFEYYD